MLASLSRLIAAHQSLPILVRVQCLVPETLFVVTASGSLLTLPPGPLCDEGMVLFFEGGCDYGESNIFFHSKLGLLLVAAASFVACGLRGSPRLGAFAPHFAVGAWLIWALRSGGHCDSYYSHPNGSVGQMVLEIAAFAILGIAIIARWPRLRLRALFLGAAAWNALGVAVFYLWLLAFDHWTWCHTLGVSLTLATLAALVRPGPRGSVWLPPAKRRR